MSKRTAEEAGAIEDIATKRRLVNMHLPKMPGAWPDDEEVTTSYVAVTSSTYSISTILKAVFNVLNPLQYFYNPTITTPSPPKPSTPFKSFFELPEGISRASPYKYKHGVNRPKKSILRSSRPDFKPLETSLTIPSPQKYVDEDHSPVDEDGDIEMNDIDIPFKSRKITLSSQYKSWITGEPVDSVKGVGHYYQSTLGIGETYGEQYKQYRDPKPEFDPDESYLDSPKPAGFNQEQDQSPSKSYPKDDYNEEEAEELPESEDVISIALDHWYAKLQARNAELGESTPLPQRYAEVERQRDIEKAAKWRAKQEGERLERKRLWIEEKERIEHMMAQKRLQDMAAAEEAERLEEEQAAQAEYDAKVETIKRAEKRAELRKITENFNPNHMDNPKISQALQLTNPGQIVIEAEQISRHDLGTLFPANPHDSASGWLNDAIVNTSLLHLVNEANRQAGHSMAQKDTAAPYWVFNSGWVSKIGNGSGLQRWAAKKGVNLSEKRFMNARMILFPVCEGSHWTMTILNPQDRTIESMNSMNSPSYDARIRAMVLSWVRFQLGDDWVDKEWKECPRMSKSQDNASDCGVFTILNSIARVANIPTWSMRKQVCASEMARGRSYIGGLLFNGGYSEMAEPWRLKMIPEVWDGPYYTHPNYTNDNYYF